MNAPARDRFRQEPPPPVIAGRAPPHDLDAEASVLSACMSSSDAIDDVADVLRPEHFYSEANRLVYEAIAALHVEGVAVDIVTVAGRLRAGDAMSRVGGASYLALIVDATPAALHVRDHALKVRELWRARRLIAACQRGAAEGYACEADVAGYLDSVGTAVFGCLDEGDTSDTTAGIKEILTTVFEEHQAAVQGRSDAVTLGLVDVDRKLRLGNGDLMILAARPGMGKTAFAVGRAPHVADGPKSPDTGEYDRPGTVLVFSAEMPKEQLAARLVCTEGGVDLQRLRTCTLTPDDYAVLTAAGSALAARGIVIDDRSQPTVLEMRAVSRRVARKAAKEGRPLRLIVVDYLQLCRGEGRSREEEVASISRGLKALAKAMKVPVIALSQLNRAGDKRGAGARPELSDLRESGSLEQDADAVVFIHREDYHDENTPNRGIAEIIIRKQRNGPTGTVRVRYYASCTRFETLAPGTYADAEDYA